ncbi:hypothetical protein C8J23_10149 [Shewanella chilikensis]|uniref:Uncharacterized protein n=1 Tax=Shewanella chilikensis TaxID=558541 RepID=A0ABX5PT17_9GAMM|nr:hypothetical protein C8J23_10149 [Shewanella chilikensis]
MYIQLEIHSKHGHNKAGYPSCCNAFNNKKQLWLTKSLMKNVKRRQQKSPSYL